MYLHHYFNRNNGPFLSISDLPRDEAFKAFHRMIRFLTERDGGVYAPEDDRWKFVCERHKQRRDMESEMRRMFIEKNGEAPREYPYYLILSPTDVKDESLFAFYENPGCIVIPVEEFDMNTVSFTYGDSFALYYGADDRPDIIYTYAEILEMAAERGWPPKNENAWGFVEAQLWSDEQISKYRRGAPGKRATKHPIEVAAAFPKTGATGEEHTL